MNSKFPTDNESSFKDEATDPSADVKGALRDTKEKIKAKSKEFATEAKEKGEDYIRQGRERAADRIGAVSESVRQTAERFDREDDPNIAEYTRRVADKLEHAARYVRQRDLNQLRHDTENLARRYPTMFFGSLFVAGLAAARFLKASSVRDDFSSGQAQRQEQPATAFSENAPGHEQELAQPFQGQP
jgi:hypothetical protein